MEEQKMKETRKFFTTMMAMMAMALMLPMQVKAAEAAQPVVETENIQLVELKEGYYKQCGEGYFIRHDENGQVIYSSTTVEKALFCVNSTLTSGWDQLTLDANFIKGTFKDATLDTEGYLRCSFTTESGVLYDEVIVKVKPYTYKAKNVDTSSRNTGNGGNTNTDTDNGNGGNTDTDDGNGGNTDTDDGNGGNTDTDNGNGGNTDTDDGNGGNTDTDDGNGQDDIPPVDEDPGNLGIIDGGQDTPPDTDPGNTGIVDPDTAP